MCRVPAAEDCAKITAWGHENVKDTDLAKDGRENDVHTTVAYGFTPDVTPKEVSDVIAATVPDGVVIRLGTMSFFDTDPEHDVLKVDVESEGLTALHYALRKAFGKRLVVSFPTYHAHLTIAYLKKGACRHLLGNASFAGWTLSCKQFTYSTPCMAANYALPLIEPPVVSDMEAQHAHLPNSSRGFEEALSEASTFHPDLLDDIHRFENGELNPKQVVAMFKKMGRDEYKFEAILPRHLDKGGISSSVVLEPER